MDYDQLKTFVDLAQTGSFSITAENLNVTQPAISKRIALLETELNCVLFDRIGKQNILTAAGDLALNRAKRILNESKELRHDIENLSDSVSGRLVISTSHHIGLHRLPIILKEYVRQYTQVDLDMRFTDSEIAYNDVLHGETSLAIATLPEKITDSSISSYPLWLDHLVLVCARYHPLTKIENVKLHHLESHNAILPGEETFTRRIINQYFYTNRLSLNIAFETNYLETIKVMVASGLGWSVLPQILADDELTVIPLDSLKLTRTLGIMLNTGLSLPNSAIAMVELLKLKSDYPNMKKG